MLYESLDPPLESGIASICAADWSTAQAVLSQRLEQTGHLGRRRLNLFLLAIVAGKTGHGPMAEQLAEVARQTPVEMGEPRDFGTVEDPVRRQLEQTWWVFNGWNPQPSVPTAAPAKTSAQGELDWAAVLDATMEGRAGELERLCSRYLEGNHPQRRILWNLVALGYLESGDYRTYEEMRDGAPRTPGQVPEPLRALLTRADFTAALADLEAGRWLTSDSLIAVAASAGDGAGTDSQAWEREMEASFALLSDGRMLEASRKLGPLSLQSLTPLERAYTLNAMALALFSSGEYGEAEDALRECRGVAGVRPETDPELAARYAAWLHSAGARPVPGSAFCDPFNTAGAAPAPSQGAPATAAAPQQTYWSSFEQTLDALQASDFNTAKRTLRSMVSLPEVRSDRSKGFLTALLFAGTAMLEGDHMEAQESVNDATRLLRDGAPDAGVLVEAQGRFAAAGAMTIALKMDPESLSTLDPWRDFPADFPLQNA